MSVTKVIKFYQFEPLPSLKNNGIVLMSTIDLLKKVFPTCSSYNVKCDKDKYIIDILEIGYDFVFGKCAKVNDLPFSNFYQMRNKHTNTAEPFSSFSPDKQLEVYTFFYINCTQNRMSAIQHKNITKIQNVLSEGILELSGNTVNFFVAPEHIKNVKQTAKKIRKNKKLSISFAPNASSKYNIDNLSKSLGGIPYDSFSVEIKLSQANTDSDIDKIYETFQNDKESFNSLKLIGKTDSGFEETIDFIETLFTHCTDFNISEDTVNNYDIIH